MMNLFLVVTSIQFQKTKKIEAERKKKLNNYSQSTGDSEESSFWQRLLKSIRLLVQYFFKKCSRNEDLEMKLFSKQNSHALKKELLVTNDKKVDQSELNKSSIEDYNNWNTSRLNKKEINLNPHISKEIFFKERNSSVDKDIYLNNQSILIGQNLDKPKELKETANCSSFYESLLNSKFFRVIDQKRVILKEFVDGKLQPIILGAILINTLSMAIEHHEQVDILKINF